MAPQAACVHEGGGVERRAAHHERERQRRQREAAGGTTEPAAEEAMDVEAVSAADVLAGVEESGPNYALPTAREGQRERRERLRVDETAKQAGHTIVETGTHVEILGEQGLWWPATIAGREEDVDGRLVHEVEYDGHQGEQYWHMLDDEQWRRATAMPTPADGTNAAASRPPPRARRAAARRTRSPRGRERARIAARRPCSIANWPTCSTRWTTSGRRRPCGRTISLC